MVNYFRQIELTMWKWNKKCLNRINYSSLLQASLRTRTGMHTCGATILATDWILTAAHCIYSENPEDYSVQYGTNEISRNGDYIVKVKKIVVHQGYDGDNNFIHDIAVLQLEEPIEFNKNVHPVQIPEYLELTEGGVGAMVVGWGYNDVSGKNLYSHFPLSSALENSLSPIE